MNNGCTKTFTFLDGEIKMKKLLLSLFLLSSFSSFGNELEVMSYSYPKGKIVKPNDIVKLEFSYKSDNPNVCYNLVILDNSTGKTLENSVSGPAFEVYDKFSDHDIAQGVDDSVEFILPDVIGEYSGQNISVGVILTEEQSRGCDFFPINLANKKVGKTIFKEFLLMK